MGNWGKSERQGAVMIGVVALLVTTAGIVMRSCGFVSEGESRPYEEKIYASYNDSVAVADDDYDSGEGDHKRKSRKDARGEKGGKGKRKSKASRSGKGGDRKSDGGGDVSQPRDYLNDRIPSE